MNLFQCVNAAVTTKQAAEYYGVQVRRNGMILCPFHNDHHPSKIFPLQESRNRSRDTYDDETV